MTLLIIFLFIFLIFGYPLLKIYLGLRAARNRFSEMFGAQQRTSGRPDGQRPKRRAKIITRDVGEYVEFEDLPGQSDTDTTAHITYTETSQIEDVEWEDIDPRRR